VAYLPRSTCSRGPQLTRARSHLLNFQYGSPPTALSTSPVAGGAFGARRGSRAPQPPREPLSREAFLQAHFRFLVLQEAAARVPGDGPRAQADAMVAWADVVRVEALSRFGDVTCPICLDAPVAPQVTPCGHTFCFACIGRHMSTDRSSRDRCPLCATHLLPSELRGIVHTAAPAAAEGQPATFSLLRRPKDSLAPSPLAPEDGAKSGGWPLAPPGSCRASLWAKFTLCSDEAAAVAEDARALDAASAAASAAADSPALSCLLSCADALRLRAAAWAERRAELRRQGWQAPVPGGEGLPSSPRASPAEEEAAAAREETLLDSLAAGVSEGPESRRPRPARPKPAQSAPPERDWLFYQASDGSVLSPHPLSVRVLLAAHGSYSAFPAVLTARVLSLERGAASEESRRRLRFLSHLPLRTPFELAELDLEGAVPEAAWDSVREERQARAARRAAERARDEAQRAAAARAEEAAVTRALAARVAARGPDEVELAAMPGLPGSAAGAEAAAAAAAASPPPPNALSFARVTDLGYASGANAPLAWPPAGEAARPAAAWGPRAARPAGEAGAPAEGVVAAAAGGGKKKGQTLLFSTSGGGRRY